MPAGYPAGSLGRSSPGYPWSSQRGRSYPERRGAPSPRLPGAVSAPLGHDLGSSELRGEGREVGRRLGSVATYRGVCVSLFAG